MPGHELDLEADQYSQDILKRELMNQYMAQGFDGFALQAIVQKEFFRLNEIRQHLNWETMQFEQNRLPVNTIEYEWKQDDAGNYHLWHREFNQFVYKMYENTREYAQKSKKQGIYSEEEYQSFLEIEHHLFYRKAQAAIMGVHHESQLTRYVQQLYTDGDKVRMAYIDVGIPKRDLYAHEAQTLIKSFASEREGRILQGKKDGFVYVLSKTSPLNTDYIREVAAVKVLVADSFSRPEASVHFMPAQLVGEEENSHTFVMEEKPVIIPTLIVGEWLERKKQTNIEVKTQETFVERIVQTLKVDLEEDFVEVDSIVLITPKFDNETIIQPEIKEIKQEESISEPLVGEPLVTTVTTVTEKIPVQILIEEPLVDYTNIVPIRQIIHELKTNLSPVKSEHFIPPTESANIEQTEQRLEFVIEHTPEIEARIEQAEQTLEIIPLVIENPELLVLFLGSLETVIEPVNVEKTKEKESLQEGEVIKTLERLAEIIEFYSFEKSLNETPLAKSTQIHGTEEGIVLETPNEIITLSDIPFIAKFAFIIGILKIIDLKETENSQEVLLQGKKTSYEVNEQHTWLLLAIIVSMAQIREQGMMGLMTTNVQKKIKKRKKDTFPQSGVIFMVSLAYE